MPLKKLKQGNNDSIGKKKKGANISRINRRHWKAGIDLYTIVGKSCEICIPDLLRN
ncbi:hypothetical protein ES332_D13G147200v1 [Gossypium tomentosum]|uniref:Uncharacterized protein n=1 Tax=Gossypium tomentosum TaxID=34277 RepID=A0A5D2HX45_GOSTO|nr:hypothetical protein ES332_D13G147200v1 [Gossypium tomentosum]